MPLGLEAAIMTPNGVTLLFFSSALGSTFLMIMAF